MCNCEGRKNFFLYLGTILSDKEEHQGLIVKAFYFIYFFLRPNEFIHNYISNKNKKVWSLNL